MLAGILDARQALLVCDIVSIAEGDKGFACAAPEHELVQRPLIAFCDESMG